MNGPLDVRSVVVLATILDLRIRKPNDAPIRTLWRIDFRGRYEITLASKGSLGHLDLRSISPTAFARPSRTYVQVLFARRCVGMCAQQLHTKLGARI